MGKSYTPFNEAKFALGSLCKRGHDWKGTGQSLRRIVKSGRQSGKPGTCIECLKLNKAAYREKSPDAARASNRKWYHQNREREKKKRQIYGYRNRDKHKVRSRARRDRAAFAPALYPCNTPSIQSRVSLFDFACAYCGAKGTLHIDHFLPLSAGNALTLGNAVPACRSCNASKRASDPHDWYRRQPFYCHKRWAKILRVLGKHKHHHGQMTLI